jgi:hypothetical protein
VSFSAACEAQDIFAVLAARNPEVGSGRALMQKPIYNCCKSPCKRALQDFCADFVLPLVAKIVRTGCCNCNFRVGGDTAGTLERASKRPDSRLGDIA